MRCSFIFAGFKLAMIKTATQKPLRECGELLLRNRFPLKMKGKVLLLLAKVSDTVRKRHMVLTRT